MTEKIYFRSEVKKDEITKSALNDTTAVKYHGVLLKYFEYTNSWYCVSIANF